MQKKQFDNMNNMQKNVISARGSRSTCAEPHLPHSRSLHRQTKGEASGPSEDPGQTSSAFSGEPEDWCKSIAKPVLEFQNKTWAKFKKEWLHPPYALDIIGLMIWARAYHLQICIVFNYNFWTTQATIDLSKVNIFLVYRGNNIFEDTRMMGSQEYASQYKSLTRTARKIERYFKSLEKEKEQKRKQKEIDRILEDKSEESSSDEENAKLPEDPSVDNEKPTSDIDMERILEENDDSVQKKQTQDNVSDSDNVQKKPTEDEVSDSDNVQNEQTSNKDNGNNNVQNNGAAVLNEPTDKETEDKKDEKDDVTLDENHQNETEEDKDVKGDLNKDTKADESMETDNENNVQITGRNLRRRKDNVQNNVYQSRLSTAAKLINKAKSEVKGPGSKQQRNLKPMWLLELATYANK